MRAVNLIPADARRGRALAGVGSVSPTHALIAVLSIAVVFMTIYVLTQNTISDRKAKIASLQGQVAQEQALAKQLSKYVQFQKLAQARMQTVRQIASSRFDWHGAMSDLSKVVPSNTSLQVLLGTVAPGAAVSGPGGSAGGTAGPTTAALRGQETGPAFELKGCTRSHDDVARLMSRLRLMNEVTRVTLADTQKPEQAAGAAAAGGSGSSGTSGGGCGSDAPTFDVVVFFNPIPNAGPSGLAAGSQQVSTPTGAASSAAPSASASRPVSGSSSGASKCPPGTAR